MSQNLPPGVSLSDVDGSDECPKCEGFGEVPLIVADTDTEGAGAGEGIEWVTCPRCGGLGVKGSTRGADAGKFTDDIKPGE